ncbi:MAG TPA: TerC family protein [Methylocystis sp.]|nr:TerC family protein [Methylocystis sp.]
MSVNVALLWEALEIVWINILLSGDNAVLIALACRRLPQHQRRLGVVLGALGGVALRIAFTLVVVGVLRLPYVKLAGAALLLYVAIRLPNQHADHAAVEARPDLWSAVATIVAADAIMSLDNVIAIAAAAHGSTQLIIFGLALSVPIIMFGAGALLALFERLPILMWGGAGVLGWVAGELCASDALWESRGVAVASVEKGFAAAGAVIVLAAAGAIRWSRRR